VRVLAGVVGLLIALMLAACGGGGEEPEVLVVGGIPDQDLELLEERFGGIANYLSEELGMPVVYRPSVDYAAIVTAFRNGDIHLGWFGALTGVQAAAETPGANVLAQRPIDAEFVSNFIVHTDVDAATLDDLVGRTFTFGSEGSTSGHVMPRYFLQEHGIDPERDFEQVTYSGAHDAVLRLVEAGSFDAGVLSTEVWERASSMGEIDHDSVEVLWTTPPYANYHWLAHPDLDDRFGASTTERLRTALLAAGDHPDAAAYVRMFEDDRFVPASPEDLTPLESIARELGLIGE
jgi:phosphonate transport system substrate-binding protein